MTNPQPVDLTYKYLEPPECLHDKAPIIFMHGMVGCKENWNGIADIIAKSTRRKTYVVDARNHGDSPWTDFFNLDVNVIDVLKLMDTINAPSAILIGHSMGGITAYKTAIRAPERVEKIVVEDIGIKKLTDEQVNMLDSYLKTAQCALQQVPSTASEEEAQKSIVDAVVKSIPPEALSQVEKMQLTKPKFHPLGLKKTESGTYAIKANVASILKAVKEPHTFMWDVTGVYNGPCSFIHGTISHLDVSSHKEDIKKFFPHAEFVEINGASHMVHFEYPKEFVNAVLEFLLRE